MESKAKDSAEARAAEMEVITRQAKESGRLELALQIKALLRGVILMKGEAGARQPTWQEQKIWDIVEGVAERMGAESEPESDTNPMDASR